MERILYFSKKMNNITPRLEKVLTASQKVAFETKNKDIKPEHVFICLLHTTGIGVEILKNTGVSFDVIQKSILEKINRKIEVKNEEILFSKELDEILSTSASLANELSHAYVGTEHVLICILEKSAIVKKVLESSGVKIEELIKTIKEQISIKSEPLQKIPSGGQEQKEEKLAPGELYIKKFSVELTERAAKNELDPVIGREKEINRTLHILCRKKKNNPILVGPAGVGKTSIAEGIAIKISQKKVPADLRNKRIFSLDFAQMVSGTIYRGQFEERLKKIIFEVKNNPDFIVFIDEIHNVIGAGGGSIDAAEMLKPALARGEFRCIGATTENEFRDFEKDQALERRFQKVIVNEPSDSETLEILKGCIKSYETHHGVKYDEDALIGAISLSNRFIQDRYQPDKSMDVIDEAGAAVKLSYNEQKDVSFLTSLLEATSKNKSEALSKGNFELSAELKKQEDSISFKIMKAKIEGSESSKIVKVTDVQKVISMWSGVPAEDLGISEKCNLLALSNLLKTTIVGQDDAINFICRSLQKYKTPFKDANRPIGGFLFCGGSGIGKTLLAKETAIKAFGSEKALLHLDMSEFSDSIAVSKLVGAPAGYIGYEDGAKLCRFVQKHPYSVILFDELEKAHEDVKQILLQILEDGKLTDNTGKEVNFKNTIIICTSNIISGNTKSLGFASGAASVEIVKQKVIEDVKHCFKSELLNRMQLVVFNQLTEADAKKIAEIEIEKLNKRLIPEEICIKYGQNVIDFLVKKGFSETFGGRNIRKQVEFYIEDKLTHDFLESKIVRGDTVVFSLIDDEISHKIFHKEELVVDFAKKTN